MEYKAPAASPLVYGLVKFVLFTVYKVLFGFQCYGSENVPPATDVRGVILAPNHASFLDPPILGISLRRHVVYLAKEYLFRTFFVGWILRSIGALPIKAGREDFRSLRTLLSLLRAGKCVALFPEGTRSLDGQFMEPETGVGFLAVKSQAYVLPVYIQGTYEALPKGARWFRPSRVKAYFGRPFIPPEEEGLVAGAGLYAEVSRRIMDEIQKIKRSVEGPE